MGQALTKRKCWFIGDELYSVKVYQPGAGMVQLIRWGTGTLVTMSTAEFKRKRKKAFMLKEVAELLNYKVKYLKDLQREGVLPRGTMRKLFEEPRILTKPVYYQEEMIYLYREILAQNHWGRLGQHGVQNFKVPSETQLSAKLNKAYVTYIQAPDGSFVPSFPETI